MPAPRPLGPDDPGRIGGYQLTAVLGRGGQGTVYLGRAPSGADVAVKVLHAWMAEDDRARRLFMREADLARRVAPFCTARVLDLGLHGERPYIVSEYVPGPALDAVVRESGPRQGSGLERIAVATASALAAIHRAGIVHRDLKPSNVILGPEGPVVIDFGISRAGDQTVTKSGSIGTPGYMAPEQITGDVAGPSADVFSWAATIVYAATGRRAFPGESIPALLHSVMNHEPDLTGVPATLAPLLARCLDKEPARRPTAAEVHRSLTGDAPALPATTPETTTPETSTPTTSGPTTSGPTTSGPTTSGPETSGLVTVAAAPGPAGVRRAALTMGAAVLTTAAVLIVSLLARDDAGGGRSAATTTVPAPAATGGPTPGRSPEKVPGKSPGTGGNGVAAPPFGSLVHTPLTGHGNDARTVALGVLGGTPVALTGSDDTTARVWDLVRGAPLGAPLKGHARWVRSVALVRLGGAVQAGAHGEAPIAVTAADDGTVRMWDLDTRRQIGTPLTGHSGGVKAVAAGELSGAPVAVSGGQDGTVRVWDLTTHRQLGTPLSGHDGTVWSVALGTLDGTPVAVTGGEDGTVRVWDLKARRQLGPALTGHRGRVLAVAAGEAGGAFYAVSGGGDATVRTWDLTTHRQTGEPLTGHTAPIWSVALGTLYGEPVAVSGGEDRTVRVWSLRTRAPVGAPLAGHDDIVWAVAFGELPAGPVAVSGSRDETVRVWSLAER